MKWSFEPDRPIYLQLREQILLRIVSGAYPPGAKLPPVRDMAAEAAVNPNTLQRALSDLEREGLVHAQRTSGRYVTEDENVIRSARVELAREQVETFLKKMAGLGFSGEEALKFIEKAVRGEARQ